MHLYINMQIEIMHLQRDDRVSFTREALCEFFGILVLAQGYLGSEDVLTPLLLPALIFNMGGPWCLAPYRLSSYDKTLCFINQLVTIQSFLVVHILVFCVFPTYSTHYALQPQGMNLLALHNRQQIFQSSNMW